MVEYTKKDYIALLKKVIQVGDQGDGSTSDILYSLKEVQNEIRQAVPEIKKEEEEHYQQMEWDAAELFHRPWETDEEFENRKNSEQTN